jgi:predicted GIY-YIG superfamily endonuclease
LSSIGKAAARNSLGNTACTVHVETFQTAIEAITREKHLKKWKRDWKIQLIETDNLAWRDLSGLMI